MLKWIYKHRWLSFIIFIVIIAMVPIITNFLSTIESNYEPLWAPSPWLIFWGTYLAASASLGMIIITAVSIYINSEENKVNRILQVDTILYQTKINWVNLLKDYTTSLINALNDDVHSKFALFYNNNIKRNINFSELINSLISDVNISKFKLDSLLIGETNPETEIFRNSVNEYYNRFLDLLLDLQFFFNINKLWLKEEFEEKVAEYKDSQLKSNNFNNGTNRIWEIIKEYNYNLDNYSEYLVILMRRYDIQKFKNNCVVYIQNETKKANDILNGTEQDK